MNRIKKLNLFQKALPAAMIVMVLVLTVIYAKKISRVGF